MNYISLHNHTQYSNTHLLDCIIKPKDLIDQAIKLGFNGVAITDHDCLSGTVDVLKIRDEISKTNPNFKIIFGNEIYLIDEKEIKNTKYYYHFILLAKDQIGWEQLKELSSRAWIRSYFEKGVRRTPTTNQDIEEIVGKNPGHLLCMTACLGSRLNHYILNHKVKEANEFIRWCITQFGKENIAIELQPSDSDEQKTVNPILLNLAKHYNLSFVVTTDTHYLEKDDFNIHAAFINSRSSNDREASKFYRNTYMMSIDEMKQYLALSNLSENDIDECINNTVDFTKDIANFDFRQSTIIPAPNLPDFVLSHTLSAFYDKYECIKYFAYSNFLQDQYLIYQIEQGIKNKNIIIDDIKANRINTELDVLRSISNANNQPMSGYLNLVRTIEDLIWENSIIGVARGSAMCFYINYLIGIVQCNPLEYDVDYWRFLNKARSGAGNFPDVDIDIAASKTDAVMQTLRKYFGDNKVINCITFKTESLKSAILTACRGCNINNDDAQALAAMVPVTRGKVHSLLDCLNGNEDLGYDPEPTFVNKLKTYPKLFETVSKIEGLVSGSGIHASCVYLTNKPIQNYVPCMRAPNNTLITGFNMHDSDLCGILKFDLLRTDAEEKIMKCLELLIKDNVIQWQGTLKATYDKYLHPDHLVYDDPQMWQDLSNGKIEEIFQFNSAVGENCIKKTRPENIKQMGAANAVMRLQASDGEEAPIDRYVRFRNDIKEWYKELQAYNLTSGEIKILEKYLLHKFGCAVEQEDVMLLLMDKDITNFSLQDADKARKTIAKKHFDEVADLKNHFFKSNFNTRVEFLTYVWEKCIVPQLSYSFSVPHDIAYSLIGWQEVNLAERWNKNYWSAACLCVNAGIESDDFSENENDDEEEDKGACVTDAIEENNTPEEAVRRVAPNYKKIAKALDDAQRSGVKISLPDINTAEVDFTPDIQNNAIKYSLKAITAVGDDLLNKILTLRPFASPRDFYERAQPTTAQMIGLIKAGCFDNLVKKPRENILRGFLRFLAAQEYPLKDRLTTAHIKKALDLGLKLDKYSEEIRMYHFKKYIDKNQHDKESRRYILNDESCINFFNNFVMNYLDISKNEYGYLPNDQIFVKESSFKRIFDKYNQKLMEFLNSEEGREQFKELEQETFIQELLHKYCQGTVSTWEMDTMCFYYHDHELKYVNEPKYSIKNFNKLPEVPVTHEYTKNGTTYTSYDLCAIAGTVIGTDNTRHIVTLSTTHGVVNVKLYAGTYTQYNARLSKIDPKTKIKTVTDES